MPHKGQTYNSVGPYRMLLALTAYRLGYQPYQICHSANIATSTFFRWNQNFSEDAESFMRLLNRIERDGRPMGSPVTW